MVRNSAIVGNIIEAPGVSNSECMYLLGDPYAGYPNGDVSLIDSNPWAD